MVGRTGIEPVTISLSLCIRMFNKAEIMIPLSLTPQMSVDYTGSTESLDNFQAISKKSNWWREVESNQPNHEGADLQSTVFTVLLSLRVSVLRQHSSLLMD